MIAMGFPSDHCKKALVRVNNESLSAALDVVLVIAEEEKQKFKSRKPVLPLLVSEWHCP